MSEISIDNFELNLKRRKNSEASKRFRVRKRQLYNDNLNKLSILNGEINKLNLKLNYLIIENNYWKEQIISLNKLRINKYLNDLKEKMTK